MPFRNYSLTKGGALTIGSIHSPGFTASPLAGWSIDKNGNAYFESVTIGGGVVRVTFASSAPASPNTGDVWFDTANGTVSYWSGSAWSNFQYGTSAIASGAVTASNIAAATITAAQIAASTILGSNIEAGTVSGLNTGAAFHGLNMIPDPQWSSAALNAVRLADPATNAMWTFSAGTAAVTAGTPAKRLALMPSAVQSMWVSPGEQYYLSVTGVTSASCQVGIEMAFDAGATQTLSATFSGTQTVSGTVTVPAGAHFAYVRVFAYAASGSPTATLSAPVCTPAQLTGSDWTLNGNGLTVTDGTADIQAHVNATVGAPAVELLTGAASEHSGAAVYNLVGNAGLPNEYENLVVRGPASTFTGNNLVGMVLTGDAADGSSVAAGHLQYDGADIAYWWSDGLHVLQKLFGTGGIVTLGDPARIPHLSALTGATVTNSTTRGGVGSYSIPAGDPQVNSVYKALIWGTCSSAASSPGTLQIQFRIDGVNGGILASTPAIALNAGMSNKVWSAECEFLFNAAGSSGAASGLATFQANQLQSVSGQAVVDSSINVNPVNTTIPVSVNVTAQFSVASASNTCQGFYGVLVKVAN